MLVWSYCQVKVIVHNITQKNSNYCRFLLPLFVILTCPTQVSPPLPLTSLPLDCFAYSNIIEYPYNAFFTPKPTLFRVYGPYRRLNLSKCYSVCHTRRQLFQFFSRQLQKQWQTTNHAVPNLAPKLDGALYLEQSRRHTVYSALGWRMRSEVTAFCQMKCKSTTQSNAQLMSMDPNGFDIVCLFQ